MLEGAEMMVRCFDRSQLVGGGVVMDFMASLKLKLAGIGTTADGVRNCISFRISCR